MYRMLRYWFSDLEEDKHGRLTNPVLRGIASSAGYNVDDAHDVSAFMRVARYTSLVYYTSGETELIPDTLQVKYYDFKRDTHTKRERISFQSALAGAWLYCVTKTDVKMMMLTPVSSMFARNETCYCAMAVSSRRVTIFMSSTAFADCRSYCRSITQMISNRLYDSDALSKFRIRLISKDKDMKPFYEAAAWILHNAGISACRKDVWEEEYILQTLYDLFEVGKQPPTVQLNATLAEIRLGCMAAKYTMDTSRLDLLYFVCKEDLCDSLIAAAGSDDELYARLYGIYKDYLLDVNREIDLPVLIDKLFANNLYGKELKYAFEFASDNALELYRMVMDDIWLNKLVTFVYNKVKLE